MLYAGLDTLRGLGYVVMDEVHYLADRFRGAVWEEVIIHLPESVRLVVAVGDGEQRRGVRRLARRRCAATPTVVVEEHRPVPLWQHVMAERPAVRPVRRRRAQRQGQPRAACGWPATRTRSSPRRRRDARPQPRRPRGRGATRRPEPGRGRSSGSTREATAARDHLHLQPGRLRRRRAAVPARRAAAAPRRTSAIEVRAHVEAALRGHPRRGPRASSATTSGSTAWSAASPRTTPGCCRPSRRSSRSCSSAAWSRPCSPPRRWRSASTCRPAPSCSSGWSSGTARRTPTSRRGSTPS